MQFLQLKYSILYVLIDHLALLWCYAFFT